MEALGGLAPLSPSTRHRRFLRAPLGVSGVIAAPTWPPHLDAAKITEPVRKHNLVPNLDLNRFLRKSGWKSGSFVDPAYSGTGSYYIFIEISRTPKIGTGSAIDTTSKTKRTGSRLTRSENCRSCQFGTGSKLTRSTKKWPLQKPDRFCLCHVSCQ